MASYKFLWKCLHSSFISVTNSSGFVCSRNYWGSAIWNGRFWSAMGAKSKLDLFYYSKRAVSREEFNIIPVLYYFKADWRAKGHASSFVRLAGFWRTWHVHPYWTLWPRGCKHWQPISPVLLRSIFHYTSVPKWTDIELKFRLRLSDSSWYCKDRRR